MVQSVLQGMFIEGGARWGYDALWVDDSDLPILKGNLNAKKHNTSAERRQWCHKIAT
jgi:hypothetical protein